MYENVETIRADWKETVTLGPGETWQGEGLLIGNAFVLLVLGWAKTDKNAEFKWYASTDGVTLGLKQDGADRNLTGGAWTKEIEMGSTCTPYFIPTIKNTSGDSLSEIEIYVWFRFYE
jgi:hypothetical protein